MSITVLLFIIVALCIVVMLFALKDWPNMALDPEVPPERNGKRSVFTSPINIICYRMMNYPRQWGVMSDGWHWRDGMRTTKQARFCFGRHGVCICFHMDRRIK